MVERALMGLYKVLDSVPSISINHTFKHAHTYINLVNKCIMLKQMVAIV